MGYSFLRLALIQITAIKNQNCNDSEYSIGFEAKVIAILRIDAVPPKAVVSPEIIASRP
jgi:hypothetical protein